MVLSSRLLHKPRLLNFAGLAVVCLTLLQWVLLVWTAFTLIAASDQASFLNAQTKVPASLPEKIYVVGYSLATLGNGDYVGGTPTWKVFIAFMAFIGITVLTVMITYLVQVLSVVTTKRIFSSTVSSLGKTPEELLLNAWNGQNFSSLNHHLLHLGNQITTLAEKHLAYPVIHYYYSDAPDKSLPVTIAVLDEALTILYSSISKEHWPDHLILQSTRNSIGSFLDTLKSNFVGASEMPPPAPLLRKLGEKNVPINETERASIANDDLQQRRKLLFGLLQDEGREWYVVYGDTKRN